jgi:hypothetical protein
MSKQAADPGTYRARCENCGATRPVLERAGWQSDVCTVCANPIDD